MEANVTGLDATMVSPGITVDDLTKSITFYEGLGFGIVERWEHEGVLGGVMMKGGQAMIALGQDDWKKGRDRVKGVGLRIWISTDQDIDELAARAQAAGIELDAGPHDLPWGSRAFEVTDPDGFRLTFSTSRD